MKTRSNFGIKRTAKYLLMFAAVMFVLSFLIPVKFAKGYLEDVKEEEFFIVTFVAEQSTEGGSCILLGDQDGYFDDEDTHYVTFDGVDFREKLCWSIYNNYTEFIVYGTLEKSFWGQEEYGEKYPQYTLHSEDWDIYKEVRGGLHKRCLTVYDLKWFERFDSPPWD